MKALPATVLATVMLLASGAGAQAVRNGPEWGGLDHQPTHAGVVRRERRAGVAPSPAQVQRNKGAVQQLDRQLLRQEAVSPPGGPDRQIPPIQ